MRSSCRRKEQTPSDEIMASWSDGMQNIVPGVTRGCYKMLMKGTKGRSLSATTGRLWEKQQNTTKHDLHIRQRVDHNLLLSLFEQKNQVCSIQLNAWGPLEDETKQLPVDHEILQKGLAILVPIAELFAINEVAREELYPMRDQELKRFGKIGRARSRKTRRFHRKLQQHPLRLRQDPFPSKP